MKQTAVDWLIDKLEKEYNSFPLLNAEDCIEAQAMEKEQIKDAWAIGKYNSVSRDTAEQYYNETFKSE